MKQYVDFNLKEWIEYLENSHQQEIQLELSRIKKVAQSLDLLAPKAKIITVAGTNGKGSTVATLEAIYHEAGYQVASYTSPHLLYFNERIKINRKPIKNKELCKAFSVIEQGRGKVDLTFFEMVTLAALWHFKHFELDVIILEVGLGGNFDATNIIDCDLAIITTIDLDHQAYLGNTVEEIGYAKAGILRRNKPFIFADRHPPTTVLNQALALLTPSYICGKDYDYRLAEETIELRFQGQLIKLPRPKLHPNSVCAAVLASLLLIKDLPLNPSHWEKALKKLFLSGRLELINAEFTTLLDVSHNPQAAKLLAEFIQKYQPKKAVHAVFSALKDKDIPGLIAPLLDCVDTWFPALLPGKRAASKEQITLAFKINGLNVICYDNPLLAYKAASDSAQPGDLIVVYGSFITVAEVKPFLEEKNLTE
ncbi:MAG: bifunctional folylpolyglutamate synthase/dihydrofolate synthase [Tatlockia sp.]|nr:bifunctional folylpolyglutamate synthase/dihydrofolate synthase [Tatlockia sp.]